MNGITPVLQRFGFTSEEGGAHLARTMMLDDLTVLLADGRLELSRDALTHAIESDNLLAKRSAQSRKLALRHLGKLYALDHEVPLFRAFAYLWQREPAGRPLLAFLVAYVRDAVLRSCTPFVSVLKPGDSFQRELLQTYIDQLQPGRFSKATLKSTAQNLGGSWTQAGFLRGHMKKVRQLIQPTPAAVALALLLGFVSGERGQLLFESEYIKLLDCAPSRGVELAEQAGIQGWINFKRVGSIMEVDFPRLLHPQDKEWIVEQD